MTSPSPVLTLPYFTDPPMTQPDPGEGCSGLNQIETRVSGGRSSGRSSRGSKNLRKARERERDRASKIRKIENSWKVPARECIPAAIAPRASESRNAKVKDGPLEPDVTRWGLRLLQELSVLSLRTVDRLLYAQELMFAAVRERLERGRRKVKTSSTGRSNGGWSMVAPELLATDVKKIIADLKRAADNTNNDGKVNERSLPDHGDNEGIERQSSRDPQFLPPEQYHQNNEVIPSLCEDQVPNDYLQQCSSMATASGAIEAGDHISLPSCSGTVTHSVYAPASTEDSFSGQQVVDTSSLCTQFGVPTSACPPGLCPSLQLPHSSFSHEPEGFIFNQQPNPLRTSFQPEHIPDSIDPALITQPSIPMPSKKSLPGAKRALRSSRTLPKRDEPKAEAEPTTSYANAQKEAIPNEASNNVGASHCSTDRYTADKPQLARPELTQQKKRKEPESEPQLDQPPAAAGNVSMPTRSGNADSNAGPTRPTPTEVGHETGNDDRLAHVRAIMLSDERVQLLRRTAATFKRHSLEFGNIASQYEYESEVVLRRLVNSAIDQNGLRPVPFGRHNNVETAYTVAPNVPSFRSRINEVSHAINQRNDNSHVTVSNNTVSNSAAQEPISAQGSVSDRENIKENTSYSSDSHNSEDDHMTDASS